MNVVYLIIIYGVICICMILFNVLAIIYGEGSNKINDLKRKKYKQKIKEQFKNIENKKEVDKEHLKYIKRKLKHGNELIIIDSIITSYKRRENKYIDEYLLACKEIFIELIYHYNKKSNTEKAYYLSVIRDYNLLYKCDRKEVERILFNSLQDESFYSRDNALLAISKMGSTDKLYNALIKISNSDKFFHPNIISNSLNIFNGNTSELIKLLMDNFDKLRSDIKCSLIEYIAYYKTSYNKFILELLLSSNDRNIKLSALKYFEYISYKPALKVLIDYVDKYLNIDFNLCITAIKALRNYSDEKSINTLKKAAYSDNFKMRNMACESLAVIRLGLSAKDLDEFVFEEDVNDLYNYHIHKNKKKSGEVV